MVEVIRLAHGVHAPIRKQLFALGVAVVRAVARTIRPAGEKQEILTVDEAAVWLRIKPGTLWNWITSGKFSANDGLLHFGGATRVHFPTLRARAISGDLMGQAQKTQALHHENGTSGLRS